MKEILEVKDFKELEKLSDADLDKKINKYLKTENTSLEKLGMSGRSWLENYIKADESFVDARQVFKSFGLDFGILENQMSGVADKFSTKLQENALKMTSAGNVEEVASLTEGIMKGLTEEEQTQFMSILSEVDWSSKDAIAGLSEELDNLGIVSNDNIDKIQALENAIMDLADTKFDVSIEDAFSMSDFIQKIEEAGGKAAEFTKEELDRLTKMINVPIKEFTQTGSDAWRYQGGNQELIEMLRDEQDLLIEGAEKDRSNIIRATDLMSSKSFSVNEYVSTDEKYMDLVADSLLRAYDAQLQRWEEYTLEQLPGLKNKIEGAEEYEIPSLSEWIDNSIVNQEGERIYDTSQTKGDGYFWGTEDSQLSYQFWENSIDFNKSRSDIGLTKKNDKEFKDYLYKDLYDNHNSTVIERYYKMYEEDLNYLKEHPNEVKTLYDSNGIAIDNLRDENGNHIINTGIKQQTAEQIFAALNKGGVIQGLDEKEVKHNAIRMSTTVIKEFFDVFATEAQKNTVAVLTGAEKTQKMLEIINEHFTQNLETMKKEFLAQENDIKTYWKTLSDSQEIIDSFAEHKLFSKEIAEWKEESFAEIIERENLEYTLNAVTNSLEGLKNAAEYTTSALTKMYADDTKKFSNMVAKLEDVSETLTKDNRNTLEYTTAFSEVTNMINAFFGSSLGTDFFGTEDMQEAVEKFVSGSEEGWKAIQDEAAKMGWAELESRGMSAEDIKTIKTALSDVKEGKIFTYDELKIDLDDEKYIDAINQILGAQGFSSISDNTKETLSVIKYDTSALEKLDEDNDDDDSWQNPWDWLYNKNNEINQLIREREKLERSYQKTLEDENSSVEDVLKNRAERIGKLNEQLTEEKDKQSTAREQKNQVQAQINELGFSEYMKINAKGIMEIDHKKIEEDLDAEEISAEDGAILEALEAEWDEAHQAEQDAIDVQEEIEDEVKEIKEEGRDELSDLYDQVKEGLIMSYQEEIDALSEINDTIADSQSKMLDKIQEQIDEQRQARENEKTEQNLEDKRQRLNYLRMDTSGANAVEIAQLEKELGEEEQSYQDSLVDQQLQKLQADNEKAKEQRDRQIQLMNDQLQAYGESQIVWEDVQKILTNAWKSGEGFMTTPAGEFVGMANNIKEMNPIELEDFNKENAITTKMAEAYALQEELTNPKSSEERTNLSTLKNNIKTLESNLATKLVGTAETNVADAVHSVEQAIKEAKNNDDDNNPGGLGGTDKNNSLLPSLLNKERMKLLDEDKDNFAWQKALEMASTGLNVGKLFSNIKEHYKLSSEEDVQNFASEALKYWKPSSSFLSPTNNGSSQTSSNDSSEGEKNLSEYEMFNTIIQASSEDFKADNQRTPRGTDIAKYLDLTDSAPDSWLAMYTKQLAYFLGEARNDTERAKILQGLEDADDKLKYIGGLADNSTNIPGLDFYDKTNGRTYWVEHIDAEGHLHYIDTSSGRNTVQISEQAYDNADDWRNLKLLKYQTGGLADFTGPAWLDGTKSHPELVLNQQDTQNFIALKDILADVMDSAKGTTTNSTTNGNNYYEIEINVEGINNDYDVEQIADKIKSMIQNDAMYRNVNALQKTSK